MEKKNYGKYANQMRTNGINISDDVERCGKLSLI